jgi:hypothetical protein
MSTLFNSNLLKRLKNIEKQLQVENYIFEFEDGTHIEVTNRQFHQIWDDIHNKRHNSIYETMKEKLNQGYPDDAGLIHLMQAEDPIFVAELWKEDRERANQ